MQAAYLIAPLTAPLVEVKEAPEQDAASLNVAALKHYKALLQGSSSVSDDHVFHLLQLVKAGSTQQSCMAALCGAVQGPTPP